MSGFTLGVLQTASLSIKIWAWLPLAGEKQIESLPATTFNDSQHERFIMLTQEFVTSLFEYKDGHLFRKISQGNSKKGSLAGNTFNRGYRQVSIEKKSYLVHRVIFLMHHGYMPEFVDHIDKDKTNDRIENLRLATKSQNAMNCHVRKDNTSGIRGVTWDKAKKKWLSQIQIDNKHKFIGRFDLLSDAKKAYEIEAKQHFGDFYVPATGET